MADREVEKQLAVWARKERCSRYRAIGSGPQTQALLQNSATLDMRLAEHVDLPTGVEAVWSAGGFVSCLHGTLTSSN